MAKLVRAIEEEFPSRHPWAVVFSAAADKDVGGMLRELAPRCALLVATDNGNPRRLAPQAVAALAANCSAARTAVEPDFAKAVRAAEAVAGEQGLVLITGSLYLVGRAKRVLRRQGTLQR
jgi:dihydrofolate synthase/folylpolyglutamate synthase